MSLHRYPKYKDSGVKWLGAVPEHWDIDRIKWSIHSCKNGIWGDEAQQDENDIPCVRVADFDRQRFTVELFDPTIRNVTEKERVGRVLKKGDLLIEKSGGGENQPVGCVVLYVDEKPAVCSNFVARMQVKNGMDSSFWRYVHAAAYAVRLTTGSINQTSGIQNLDTGRYFDERAGFPPSAEQMHISVFLDRETGNIDALIAEQRQMLELLNEKVTSLVLSSISSTETKEVRLNSVARVVKRPVSQGEGESYTAIGLFNRGRGLFHKDPREANEMGDSDFFWIEEGDLILSGQFAWEGAVALAGPEDAGCVVSHRYPVLRGIPGTSLTEYLLALLMTKHGDFLLNENSRGAAGRNRPLNINSLLKEKVLIPNMQTQKRIAQAVHWRRTLLSEMSRQVEFLKERRSALISAAVTGQIDVRNYRSQEAAAVCQ
jgi:type I restriction enzyme S subunit